MTAIKDYVNFFKLARKRERSSDDYFEFEAFQSSLVIRSLKKRGIAFSKMKILDVGSGRGGYASMLSDENAKVVSLDITREFFLKTKAVEFVQGDAARLPFKSDSFDFVFCSSLIEHVKDSDEMVNEIKRVLKRDRMCYLSFPPFWSPVGSHQFKPFHYLGEKVAVKLSRKFYHVRSHTYGDYYGKLYIRTIKQVKRIIIANNMEILSLTTRMSPINFAKIPIARDFLTWHAEFLIKK